MEMDGVCGMGLGGPNQGEVDEEEELLFFQVKDLTQITQG